MSVNIMQSIAFAKWFISKHIHDFVDEIRIQSIISLLDTDHSFWDEFTSSSQFTDLYKHTVDVLIPQLVQKMPEQKPTETKIRTEKQTRPKKVATHVKHSIRVDAQTSTDDANHLSIHVVGDTNSSEFVSANKQTPKREPKKKPVTENQIEGEVDPANKQNKKREYKKKPVKENPVTENPVIENQVIENQVIENQVIENPVTENPVIENPVIENQIEGEVDAANKQNKKREYKKKLEQENGQDEDTVEDIAEDNTKHVKKRGPKPKHNNLDSHKIEEEVVIPILEHSQQIHSGIHSELVEESYEHEFIETYVDDVLYYTDSSRSIWLDSNLHCVSSPI